MRTILKLSVGIVLLAIMLGQGMSTSQRAQAQFDVQQILLGQSGVVNPNYPADSLLRVSYILQQYGLDENLEQEFCVAQDFLQLVNGGVDAAAARLEHLATAALNQVLSDILTRYTYCALADIDEIDLFFTSVKNPLPECVAPVASDFASFLKESAKDAARNSYVARCVVDSSLKRVTDTIDRMLQQMGPDGGPAVATDWLDTLNKAPYRMAQRRLWTMLAYTDICPYFREPVLDYFDVPQSYRDDPPDVSPSQLTVDGGVPFELRAACTLPENFNPAAIVTANGFIANGGFDLIPLLGQRQNYPAGFILMAEEEFQKQTAALSEVRQYQLVAGGGILGAYHPCIAGPNGDNDCVADGSILQAPGALQNIYTDSIRTQQQSLIESANAGQQILDDVGARIAVRILDFASQPIPIRLSVSPWDRPEFNTLPTPSPTPAPVPGSGEPNDPICTGGNPTCTCVQNSPELQSTISQAVAPAIAQVIQQHPEYFVSPGSNQIAPGVSYRTVLGAICSAGSNCKPSPLQDDRIVILGPTTISVDVITPAGALRTNGGQIIAACPAGVQD